MIPPSFEYFSPASLDEALGLVNENSENSRVLAGGQSMIPMLKLRLIHPKALIDLHRIRDLSYINHADGQVKIGALTTERDIERSDIIKTNVPVLSEVSSNIADVHVRNLGTVGGSICNADPAADLPPAFLALGATMIVKSIKGKRSIGVKDFFKGPFETALAENEILTEIQVPSFGRNTSASFVKLTRRAGEFPLVGACAFITLDSDKQCSACRIALCAAGPKPSLAASAGEALIGTKLSEDKISEAGNLAKKDAQPTTDVHASAEYRMEMVPIVVARAISATKVKLGVTG